MDALTAGIALMIAQLCVALVLTGAYAAAPSEKCLGYWAWSAISIAAGVLILAINHGAPRPVVQLVGSSCLVLGGVLQLWGIQAFYKSPRGNLGWMSGATFCLLFALLGLAGASISSRVLLLSTTLLVLLVLSGRVLLTGMRSRRTFGSVLTLGAIVLLMLNNLVRIAAVVRHSPDLVPMTGSATGVSILYLVPLGGIFLYAVGLLLLYFERLVDDKNHLATHDELTGILNRRAIVAAGEREVAIATRSRQPLTIAFVDIDFFKHVNDSLGHEAGDVVLTDIARLLKDTCRNVDLIGRYGGEELCVIFPGAGRDGATILGERLLAAVRQYRFHGQFPITVSAGFASLPDASGDRSWASLLHRADTALYQAKGLGRNRSCIATQDDLLTGDEAAVPCMSVKV